MLYLWNSISRLWRAPPKQVENIQTQRPAVRARVAPRARILRASKSLFTELDAASTQKLRAICWDFMQRRTFFRLFFESHDEWKKFLRAVIAKSRVVSAIAKCAPPPPSEPDFAAIQESMVCLCSKVASSTWNVDLLTDILWIVFLNMARGVSETLARPLSPGESDSIIAFLSTLGRELIAYALQY